MSSELHLTREFEINIPMGIPLREAARLVKAANLHSAAVIVRAGQASADGKSLLEVTNLPLGETRRLSITAMGYDAPECMRALAAIVESWSREPVYALAA